VPDRRNLTPARMLALSGSGEPFASANENLRSHATIRAPRFSRKNQQ
jgi:hypothetical protein